MGRISTYSVSAFAAASLVAAGTYSVLLNQAQAVKAQAYSQPPVPEITPFERNPSMFGSPQGAIKALDSPDALQRRSGVEWLGRWTYTAYGMSTNQKHFNDLQGQTLVADLIRAVREMPKDDSNQAARLLVLLGPQARPAIPAVCAEMANPRYGDGKPADGDDFVARADLLNSLTHLCGGPDGIAPTLAALMRDPDVETRRAAAAVRFCGDPTFRHLSPSPEGAYHWFTPEQDQQWHLAFHQHIVPALAVCVDDPVRVVRLSALGSLESLTHDSADAPWKTARLPLTRAVASLDPDVRLAALRVLAYMPADVSPLASSLRSGLHGGQEEQDYALAALSHAAQTSRTLTVNAFLPDLASSDLSRRRQAAGDIRLATIPLWAGSFWPGPYPLENWWNDQRLSAVPDPPGLTQSRKEAELKQRQAAAKASQAALLVSLVKAASDADHGVRTDAGLSLEYIGNWTNSLLGFGGPNPSAETRPLVEQSLAQAAASLQTTEPALAGRLQDLHTKIARGPSAVI